jgi:hypothetical protein
VNVVHLDLRVGKGPEPAGVELDESRLSVAPHSRRHDDDAVCDHLGNPVHVVTLNVSVPRSNVSRMVMVM